MFDQNIHDYDREYRSHEIKRAEHYIEGNKSESTLHSLNFDPRFSTYNIPVYPDQHLYNNYPIGGVIHHPAPQFQNTPLNPNPMLQGPHQVMFHDPYMIQQYKYYGNTYGINPQMYNIPQMYPYHGPQIPLHKSHDYKEHNQNSDEIRTKMEKPCRELFIRNASPKLRGFELVKMFEKFGPIRTISDKYIKDRGIAFVSFFDLRHAEKAKAELQEYSIHGRKLFIHFSLPKISDDILGLCNRDKNQGTLMVSYNSKDIHSITTDDLFYLFSRFGEIRGIRDLKGVSNKKFIEFYDSRSTMQAHDTLNNQPFKNGVLDIRFSWDYPKSVRVNSERYIHETRDPKKSHSKKEATDPPANDLSSKHKTKSKEHLKSASNAKCDYVIDKNPTLVNSISLEESQVVTDQDSNVSISADQDQCAAAIDISPNNKVENPLLNQMNNLLHTLRNQVNLESSNYRNTIITMRN